MSARAKGRGDASGERAAGSGGHAGSERTGQGQGPVQVGAAGAAAVSPRQAGELQSVIGNGAVARAVQRARSAHGTDAAPRSLVPEVLRSPGRPLAEPLKQEMEDRLGADFADVRLHTGADAQRSAADLGARAYTSGHHVVIGPGGTDKHTLAHELTHVIQQRNGPVPGTDNGTGLRVSHPDDTFERAAEANATRAMTGPVPRTTERPGPSDGPAPRSAGGDAPVQRMMGFEAEVALPVQDPAGAKYPGDTDLAQSTVQDFKVVSDSRMLKDGHGYSNIEFVTGAVEVVGAKNETGRERLVQLADEIKRVRDGFYAATDRTPLADMPLDLRILPAGEGARVAPGLPYTEDAGREGLGDGLFVHYSVGVPLRGMPLFFDHLREAAPDVRGATSRRARFRLGQARNFAADVLERYENWRAAQEPSKKRKRGETDALDGFAQLFFMQIAAVADYLAEDKDKGQIKNLTAVLSRSRLSDVRALLDEEFRTFLTAEHEQVLNRLSDYQEDSGDGRKLDFRDNATRHIEGEAVSLIEFANSAILGSTRVDQQSVFGGMNQIAPHPEAGATMVPFEIRTIGAYKKTWEQLKAELDDLARWADEAYRHDVGEAGTARRARGGGRGGAGGSTD
ncbi:DUF4157 domain-containing protein [Streptomyces sp. NPDC096319]|uniref:eCIS core domain-containing protein n=1 Tax=Streptomyces sp. NPDC096319 TaxID=3366084 RepID=UPI00382F63ED